MHELAIADAIVRIAERHTDGRAVAAVHVRVGALRQVVPSALSFAFETNPRACFELNGRRLPFGCHKWWHHDREFWEAYLD